MAAFTSKASGNWAASGQTTWNEVGVPGTGDTVIIANGHTVTIASGTTVTVGDSANPTTPAIQTAVATNGTGKLIVDTSATLILLGNVIQGNANWKFNATSTLSFNHASAVLEWRICDGTATNAILIFNGGTGASRITVNSIGAVNAKFTGPTVNNAGKIQATGVQFTNIGSASVAFLKCDNFTGTSYSTYFDDCLFTSCGKFDFSNNYLPAGAGFRWRRTTLRTPLDTGGLYLQLLVANGTHTGVIFDRVRCEGQMYVQGHPSTSLGVSWSDVLIESVGTAHPLECSTVPPGGTADLVLLYNKIAASAHPSVVMNGTITRLMSNRDSASLNLHAMQINMKSATTIVGGVWELGSGADESGDQFQLVNSPAGTLALGIAEIVQPPQGGVGSGTFFNCSVIGANNTQVTIERCTAVVSNTSDPAGCVVTENSTGKAGMFVAVQDMLWYRATSGDGWGIFQVNASLTNGTYTNVDYNCKVNLTTDGYQPADVAFATPSPPGTHDFTTDPVFVDPTRNFLTWGQSVDGAITTRQQIIDELMKRNDDAGWNTRFTLDAYYTWVRAGFAPTVAAFATSGHAGGQVGAVAVALSAVPVFMNQYRQRRS